MGKVKKSGEFTDVRRHSTPPPSKRSTGRVAKPAPQTSTAAKRPSSSTTARGKATDRSASPTRPLPKRGKTAARTAGRKTPAPSKRPGRTARGTRAAEQPAAKPTRDARPAKRTAATRTAKGTVARRSAAPTRKGGRPGKRVAPRKPAPEVQFKIRELNPQQKCGAGTSVVRLIRVDEIMDRAVSAHLVFFDKHGWYCEHGRTCPAVAHAQRHARQFARPQ